MGRSLYFKYSQVPHYYGNVQPQIITNIYNLKVGDKFKIKIKDYEVLNPDDNELYVPLTRTPSSYGYSPMPICSHYEYIVDNINDEPSLLDQKGLRSISFNVISDDIEYFKTYRLITDGTIRECEGLGINYVIEEIQLI
jgi:hypothetical protein